MCERGLPVLPYLSWLTSHLSDRVLQQVIQLDFHAQRVGNGERPRDGDSRFSFCIKQWLASPSLQLITRSFGLQCCDSLTMVPPPQRLTDRSFPLGGSEAETQGELGGLVAAARLNASSHKLTHLNRVHLRQLGTEDFFLEKSDQTLPCRRS